MSSYIHFYIRGEHELLPIWSSSRSSTMYQLFVHEVPYDRVRSISRNELRSFVDMVENEVKAYESSLEKIERRRADVREFDNPVDEKIEYLEALDEQEEDYKEERRAAQRVEEFLRSLRMVQETVTYTEGFDPDKYIYAGVDCWLPSIAEVDAWERGEEIEDEDE